jgi:hypothetical protein
LTVQPVIAGARPCVPETLKPNVILPPGAMTRLSDFGLNITAPSPAPEGTASPLDTDPEPENVTVTAQPFAVADPVFLTVKFTW